jgi:hypothetical protein
MPRLFRPRSMVPSAVVAAAIIAAAGCQPQDGSITASSSSPAAQASAHSPGPHHTRTPRPHRTSTPPTATQAPVAPAPTSAAATVTSTATPPTGTGTHSCTTSAPDGNCGPYAYAGITNSNGHNTYVSNNCWADPSCKQTVTAVDPGNWSVSANEPAGNGSVKTAPEVQQQFNNWCASARTWDNRGSNTCNSLADTPISGMSRLTSSYAESTPHNSQTIAQWSWDIWLSNDSGYANEVMVWVDTNGRCNSGSFGTQLHAPVTIAGQEWTPHRYPNSSEFIWTLHGSGGASTCAQQASGTVDLLALLKWMQANGYAAPGATVSIVDGLWEICSTGGQPETFTVSKYSLTAS